MNAQSIIRRLCAEQWLRNFVIPNYTPGKWNWECDLFEVTKAGYFVEYEIKISRSDFFADAAKQRDIFDMTKEFPWRTGEVEKKHDLLAAKHPDGPSRFFYVFPKGLMKPEEVPAWAGIIEADQLHKRVYLAKTRPAPMLHKNKFPEDRLAAAKNTCYYRMHGLLHRAEAAWSAKWPETPGEQSVAAG